MVYQVRQRRSQLAPADPAFIQTAPGAGPRHLVFHPSGQYVFVINELNATITSYRYNKNTGALSEIQTVSALPADFASSNTSADIHISPDGRFVYASNRGHDSIVVYQINPADGKMTYVEHENRDISRPRNFVISPDGAHVLVANRDADSIVVFQRDSDDGKLHHTGIMIDVPAPVCLKFV
jgi:6-phosphogluconolactonase